MSSKKEKIEDKICALISSDDFQKVSLLTAISKEEGANFIEIRINLENDLFALKDLSNNKYKLIFSIEPNQVIPENYEKIFDKMKQLIEYEPYAIEINNDLPKKKILALIDLAKKQEIKIHLAKYFRKKAEITSIENLLKELVEFNTDVLKIAIPIEMDYEVLELFSLYHKFPDTELILVPSGETNKFAQILTAFLGAKYTYGYINRKNSEALLPINILKRNLETLNEASENKLFQK